MCTAVQKGYSLESIFRITVVLIKDYMNLHWPIYISHIIFTKPFITQPEYFWSDA